jgi:polygalacturonase
MQMTGVYNIRDFGAAGDGVTLDTAAIQRAIDACTEAGGGTILVPPGTWLTGTIYLKSHVNLHLMAGATLLGSSRREDYNPDDIFPENPVFSRENVTGAHLIIAYQADHVSITGEGTVDGNSAAFFEPLSPEEDSASYRSKHRNYAVREWRPGQMILFCRCTNVSVRDVSLINAPYWTLLLFGCTVARVRGVRVENPPLTPNGDGIDIDCCRQVTVSDCIVSSGDDAITLRAAGTLLGEHAQPCSDVTVTNCVLSTPCNAIRIGVGDGEIRDCTFSNLVIRESRTGINIVCAYSERAAHGAIIEDIRLANIIMDVVTPINIILGVYAKPPAAARRIALSQITATTRQGGYIGGNPGLRAEEISLSDVQLRLIGDDVDPSFDGSQPRPTGSMGVPVGLFIREVNRLRIEALRVDATEVGATWRSALQITSCDDVAVNEPDVVGGLPWLGD